MDSSMIQALVKIKEVSSRSAPYG